SKNTPFFHAYPPKGIIWNPSQNLSVHHTLPILAVFRSRTLCIAGFVMKYRLTQLLSRGSVPKKYTHFHAYPFKGVIWNLSPNLSVHHTLPTLAVFRSRTLCIAGFVMKYRLTQLLSKGSVPKKYPLFHAYR